MYHTLRGSSIAADKTEINSGGRVTKDLHEQVISQGEDSCVSSIRVVTAEQQKLQQQMETLNSLRNRHTRKLINIEENKTEIITAYKTMQNWKPAHTPGKEEALKKLLSGCDDNSSDSNQSRISGTFGSQIAKSPVLNPSYYEATSPPHSYRLSIEE